MHEREQLEHEQVLDVLPDGAGFQPDCAAQSVESAKHMKFMHDTRANKMEEGHDTIKYRPKRGQFTTIWGGIRPLSGAEQEPGGRAGAAHPASPKPQAASEV